jgi:hypothetical protein
MKRHFNYVFVILFICFIVPQIAFASWWIPFSWHWNIFDIFKPRITTITAPTKNSGLQQNSPITGSSNFGSNPATEEDNPQTNKTIEPPPTPKPISTPTPVPTHVSNSKPTPTANIEANGSANPITIPYNTATTISWNSINATSCNISPSGWTGTFGNQSTGNLTFSQIYSLSCSGESGSVSANITVNVSAPTLTPGQQQNQTNQSIQQQIQQQLQQESQEILGNTPAPTPTATTIPGLASIRVDSDGWNNGPVIDIVYLDSNGNIISSAETQTVPISADVRLSAWLCAGRDSLAQTVFSGNFSTSQVMLGDIYPKIAIPLNIGRCLNYGEFQKSQYYWDGLAGVTIHTPSQGSFAANGDVPLYPNINDCPADPCSN